MDARKPFAGRSAVLATMHGKEAVIAEAMGDILGLDLKVPPRIDTDRLGTFTQDIPRPGTMDDTLKKKAMLGLELTGLEIGIASEGSYGPHPFVPFLPFGLEKMIFIDQTIGLCCIEHLYEHTPTFRSWQIKSIDELFDLHSVFGSIGFPQQALIARAPAEMQADFVVKGIQDFDHLSSCVSDLLRRSHGATVLVETDMRAHMNPVRMRTIARLANALASRLATLCPACGSPGWGRTGTETGLPCSWCAQPTELAVAEILGCPLCSHSERRLFHEPIHFADPGLCQNCNP